MSTPAFWAIVPAAGSGSRFASQIPKQYAALMGATVIEWSLAALLREPRINRIVVVIAGQDHRWAELGEVSTHPKITTTLGGTIRQDSVLSGLDLLEGHAAADDWIVVHDAARPCLSGADLATLLDALETERRAAVAGTDATAGTLAGVAAGAAAGTLAGVAAGAAAGTVAGMAAGALAGATAGTGAGVAAGAAPGCTAGALLASPIVDTIKRERDGVVDGTVDRAGLWRALTPQAFRFGQLKAALSNAKNLGLNVTDEAQAMEQVGLHARIVVGSAFNIKVTRQEDLAVAAAILKNRGASGMRVGQGFDVHAYGDGDHVILGGVKIIFNRGVVAHSDGDVVIHALCDALLGALGLNDIGQHFPDSDPRYKGADSRVFLREVARLMRAAAMTLVNADVTVLAEAPRVAPHRTAMAANLAADLQCSAACINIKATTTERLGFIGRTEGLAASASVLLDSQSAA